MPFSNYLQKKLLDYIFSGAAYSVPGTVYLGLATATITNTTTGSTVTEPSGNNYSRLSLTNDATRFPAATSNPASKGNGTAFTLATPSGSWGTVTDFFFADAATNGNILGYGVLITPKTIGASDPVSFSAAQLVVQLT